jgi:hypothetical protein
LPVHTDISGTAIRRMSSVRIIMRVGCGIGPALRAQGPQALVAWVNLA